MRKKRTFDRNNTIIAGGIRVDKQLFRIVPDFVLRLFFHLEKYPALSPLKSISPNSGSYAFVQTLEMVNFYFH